MRGARSAPAMLLSVAPPCSLAKPLALSGEARLRRAADGYAAGQGERARARPEREHDANGHAVSAGCEPARARDPHPALQRRAAHTADESAVDEHRRAADARPVQRDARQARYAAALVRALDAGHGGAARGGGALW